MVNTHIKPLSHPAHYLIHKYWGRKPHNVINEYIKYYTKEREVVLDPFMGGGGVIIEANKLRRRSIGVDINPISNLITKGTLSDIDLGLFEDEYTGIIESMPKEAVDLSLTKCPKCNQFAGIINAVWDDEHLVRLKGDCTEHGVFVKDSDEFDIEQTEKATELLKSYEMKRNLFYPREKMLDYVKRNNRTHVNQLFTNRNLLICALILERINKIYNQDIREQMQLVFTSMLPNVSKMIPADYEQVTGKSGWQISKFWIPKVNTEKNVLKSFKQRFRKVYAGKREIRPLISPAEYQLYVHSSEHLEFIDSNSIDYIFTDPPYGESISYLGLSMLWNSWLQLHTDYDSEVIYDTYRGKDYSDYSTRLLRIYTELYRVLKPSHYMSFTFHNRNLKFWKIILDSCLNSGFALSNIAWQPQAVSSGTQGINRRNTLKGDFVYTFVKEKISHDQRFEDIFGESLVITEVEKLLGKNNNFIEPARLYEIIIPIIIRNRAFLDSRGNVIDVEKLLNNNFDYIEQSNNGTIKYGWTKS